jgi:hypothetical protein
VAVTSGGTIPDRGLFGVFVAGETRNARVGELDEEMVYESRVNDVFTLGTTSWRIVEITHDRVNVLPAFGQPGKLPFWHGDGLGRPAELGEALGRFSREVAAADAEKATARLRESGLDDNAIGNLLAYLDEQKEATGSLPTDRTSRSNARATRSATGGSSCIPRTACTCTRRGPWPSTRASASAWVSKARPSRATTASSRGCRMPRANRPERNCSSSNRTSSNNS